MRFMQVFIFFSLSFFFGAAVSEAEFYRYTDYKGNTVITDDIRKLPEKYRERLEREGLEAEAEQERLKGIEALEKAQAPARPAAQVQTESSSKVETTRGASSSSPAVQDSIGVLEHPALILVSKAFGAIVATLLIFYGVGRLGDMVGFKKLGTLISLALSGLVFIYLLGSHLKIVAESYRDIMGRVTDVQKGLEKKGDSTDRVLKEMDIPVGQQETP